MSRVFIIDDEPSICWALEQCLSEEGYDVSVFANAEDAIDSTSLAPHAILMDVRLPGMDGLTALAKFREQLPETPVIIMTAFGNLETAVQAINRGALDYLTKPFNLDDAVGLVHRALQTQVVSTSTEEHEPTLATEQLLGNSPAMQAVFRNIALVAERDVPVLITGESGTGKEVIAAAIHRYSKRATGPFVPICIPAMSESVLESELFGHAKGSFTGAVAERKGLLEAADGGTAFFDEIGEIAIPTQIKLLRLMESRSITPVGGNETRKLDFRLIAATNRNLEQMVRKSEFREDLFYRLNVFRIEVPPLRDRREDIPVLAEHFIRQVDPDRRVSLSDKARDVMLNRDWPGNVRELRNAIEHAVVVTREGEIQPAAFPEPMMLADPSSPQSNLTSAVRNWWQRQLRENAKVSNLHEKFLSEAETELFKSALEQTGGNRKEASRLLGIHRQTLREKSRRYGIEDED